MIEYTGVKKSFGEQEVLKGIDLTIKDGETFFVLGKTGAGKTVMIRLLVGLLHADAGSVKIDGEEVTGLSEDEFQKIRLKCGMVFQHPTLFDSLNIFENVAFGLRRMGGISDEDILTKVCDALERVELDPAISERMPEELSFGEQKRVGLARTLVLSPKYLLYDEPTTGLDPFTASRINELIRQLNRDLNTTSIVVSHDMESMRTLADRVGLLWEGDFCFVGTVPEFMASDQPAIIEFKKGIAEKGGA